MGIAKNTVPNMCKMPGPPAPFVPTPLPNIGKSGVSPKGYSTTVKIEGSTVAIRGATFGSFGDIASKPLGGGIISMNTHGPTKFIGLGSLTVKIQGKNVQLLSDPMLNNCGPAGAPPNSATLTGEDQGDKDVEDDPCEAIKVRFKIEVASHKENTSGSTKRNTRDYQSHHIFQDKAMEALCPRAAALAIMLTNSTSNTEHGDITRNQNERRNNKKLGRPGATPGATYGELKQQARDDLKQGLQQRDVPGENRKMTPAEAAQAADCIIEEADQVAKEEYRKKTNGGKPTDGTGVHQPGGCFVAGTPVQLGDGHVRPVEQLRRGDRIQTHLGVAEVTRVDTCHHRVVELMIDGLSLQIAVNHRLFDASGDLVRADALRVGDQVQTARGPREVERVRALPKPLRIYQIGVQGRATCLLGLPGVWAELRDAGPPLEPEASITPFNPELASCPS
jgi:hypothetical protein